MLLRCIELGAYKGVPVSLPPDAAGAEPSVADVADVTAELEMLLLDYEPGHGTQQVGMEMPSYD